MSTIYEKGIRHYDNKNYHNYNLYPTRSSQLHTLEVVLERCDTLNTVIKDSLQFLLKHNSENISKDSKLKTKCQYLVQSLERLGSNKKFVGQTEVLRKNLQHLLNSYAS